MFVGEGGEKACRLGSLYRQLPRVVKPQSQNVPPSADQRFGVLELHRDGEVVHAIDMGGGNFPARI